MMKNYILPFTGLLFSYAALCLIALPLKAIAEDHALNASRAFTDVSPSSDYVEAIGYVQGKAIVNGYEDGSFAPSNTINRYDFTKIIVVANFTEDEIDDCDTATHSFRDVPRKQWFTPYVCVAKKEGIIGGYADGTFGGQNPVSVAEALKIVLETYRGELEYPIKNNGNGEWYEPYLAAGFQNGLIHKSLLDDPAEQITRSEMAYYIYHTETGEGEPVEPKVSTVALNENGDVVYEYKGDTYRLESNECPCTVQNDYNSPECQNPGSSEFRKFMLPETGSIITSNGEVRLEKKPVSYEDEEYLIVDADKGLCETDAVLFGTVLVRKETKEYAFINPESLLNDDLIDYGSGVKDDFGMDTTYRKAFQFSGVSGSNLLITEWRLKTGHNTLYSCLMTCQIFQPKDFFDETEEFEKVAERVKRHTINLQNLEWSKY